MIDLHTWDTPNGRKVSIMLEELAVPYRVHPVNIGEGAQFAPSFLKVAPNNKVPAIVDHDSGVSLMESGAILIYLARKYGKFLPQSADGEAEVLQWLMWQMGGFGPMLGQLMHFNSVQDEQGGYAQARFSKESQRLYGVLDQQLQGKSYICGTLSIADFAIWPWVARAEPQKISLVDFPNVSRWFQLLRQRPSFERGYHITNKVADVPMPAAVKTDAVKTK
ncbi:MAG: glutathione S-transferase N-terminal domain-containing protein [Rhodobacteraceae bacterium]|nr:glutathione S-transferase N-terminal domain-containing protein [Paracoccaceae bacterium]